MVFIELELAETNLTGMHVERAMLHSAIRALFFCPNRLPFPLALKMLSNGGRLPFLLAILVNSDFKKPNSACDACVMDNMVRFVIEYS